MEAFPSDSVESDDYVESGDSVKSGDSVESGDSGEFGDSAKYFHLLIFESYKYERNTAGKSGVWRVRFQTG